MIQLEHKLPSNSKLALFIIKYTPDTFELKKARQLDVIVRQTIEYYKNFKYKEICKEEFQAICIKQNELLHYGIIRKIDEYYFNDYTEHSLLSFYSDEIDLFVKVRNAAANSTQPGLGFFFESFNLSNQAVSDLMKNYQGIIQQFFRNYFAILDYKSKNPEKLNVVIDQSQNITNTSVVFNSAPSLENYIYLSLKSKVEKLQKQYLIKTPFKAKKEHAYIMEYFISLKLGFTLTEHSKRKDAIPELYNIPYKTYYPLFINYVIDIDKMRKEELAQSIIFVNQKIRNKKNTEIFDNELLETMMNHFETL